MTHNDIISTLEDFAPLELQLSWDNSGKQVGDFENQCQGAVLTLDVTLGAIEKAKSCGANLIISHHPLIFSGLKSITGVTETEQIVIEAIKSDIAIYSCHTNIDCAQGGVSWAMARRLELTNVTGLGEDGLGCYGELSCEMYVAEFVEYVKQKYELRSVRTGMESDGCAIRKVVVMGGSGASEIEAAIASGADAMVTGDLKYHDFQRAAERITLIDIGHFESEIDTLVIFMDVIQKKYHNFASYMLKQSFTQLR